MHCLDAGQAIIEQGGRVALTARAGKAYFWRGRRNFIVHSLTREALCMTSFKWMIAVLTALPDQRMRHTSWLLRTASQIEKASEPDWDVYVVKVQARQLCALSPNFPRQRLSESSFRFTNYSPQIMLRPGDIGWRLSIYETGGSSLFGAPVAGAPPVHTGSGLASACSSSPVMTTLPPQVIETDMAR